jgi:hypothetical protein
MKQYYDSVQSALKERVAGLQEQAVEAYEEAFDELEAYGQQHDVNGVLPDRDHQIRQLEQTEDPNRLEAELARVSDFKTKYRVRLRDAAEEKKADSENEGGSPNENGQSSTPRTTEPFSVTEALGQRDIEDEDDVEELLGDLRSELMKRLDEDKVIVLS